jgi:hypothetical protein
MATPFQQEPTIDPTLLDLDFSSAMPTNGTLVSEEVPAYHETQQTQLFFPQGEQLNYTQADSSAAAPSVISRRQFSCTYCPKSFKGQSELK